MKTIVFKIYTDVNFALNVYFSAQKMTIGMYQISDLERRRLTQHFFTHHCLSEWTDIVE